MRPHHLWKKFGDDQIAKSSNIVFSNGKLDPWYRNGVLSAPNAAVHAVLMRGAAHHLDLRAAHSADPQDVKEARESHKRHIKRWIAQHQEMVETSQT
jgi:hypothetical protein